MSGKLRGGGIGALLIQTLLEFATQQGYMRICLTTINGGAARFYKKMGFVSSEEKKITMLVVGEAPVYPIVFYMVFYLADKLIRTVAIVGGTHGNERIGVELIRAWQIQPSLVTRSSFTTTLVIANPVAVMRNVRFVDSDLNREFAVVVPPAIVPAQLPADEAATAPAGLEAQRAKELDLLMGPKAAPGGACDFIIDLHSTTRCSNPLPSTQNFSSFVL